jgi:hypothetical protein
MTDRARQLIFFGYSGATEPTGTRERDTSFFLVAQTLKRHLQRRFPDDVIRVICAWHKNAFVNAIRRPGPEPDLKIRQIHYAGHGAGGGLYFGYHNKVSVDERSRLAAFLAAQATSSFWTDALKRRVALILDSGLMSGFFSDALAAGKLSEIKSQLRPDALFHVWGCFAGAPTHTFDRSDSYWNLFNAGAPPVDGLARHVARTLGITATACWDPDGIHGMDFCARCARGVLNCSDVRPERLPHWLWPESKKVRWVTYNPSGVGDEAVINFLGRSEPASRIPPGRPPKWLTDEIPFSVARAAVPSLPACSAVRVPID